MEPKVVGFADGGDLLEGVEGSEDGGAGCGVDIEGSEALGFCLFYLGCEFGGFHTSGFVDGDRPYSSATEP